MPARNARKDGTLAERAYRLLKKGILRGELAEGSFLVESEILSRYAIGRTPFREACNRLHNEQLLEVVPRRGYLVPELSFRGVRDLLETRILIESMAAELAAHRAQPEQIEEMDRQYAAALRAAKNNDVDALIEANQEFHMQIARMTHNREVVVLLRGLLERFSRLVYLAASNAKQAPRDIETLMKPIADAIRKRNASAAQKAVIADITQGQLNVLGREFWDLSARTPTAVSDIDKSK